MYVHSINATINTILHEEVKKERLLYASVIVKIPVGGIFGYIASYLFYCFFHGRLTWRYSKILFVFIAFKSVQQISSCLYRLMNGAVRTKALTEAKRTVELERDSVMAH